MTTDRPPSRGVSPRERQHDLLHDLRATVPVPPSCPPSTDAAPTDPGTPAVEVRLTPLRWSAPRATQTADRTGVLLSLGPLQVALGRRTG